MTRQARTRKQAVDAAAEAYWAEYFKEYGKQWTRKIPRRVARAIAHQLTKAASSGAKTADLRIIRAQIGPIGYAQTTTGGLTFEGVFRGQTLREGRKDTVVQPFAVEFDANGKLTNLLRLSA